MQISFNGQKHIFWQVLFWLRPILGWHKHQRCTVAKYHDYDHLLYVLFLQTFRHLDTCFTTITTMNRYICTVDASKIRYTVKEFLSVFCFVDPVPPPLTQDAKLICCVNVREIFAHKRACWVTGGGDTLKH